MIEAQQVLAPLSRAALVLVVTVNEGAEAAAKTRDLCGDLSGLVRSVGFRDLDAQLSCVVGFGAGVWPRIFDDVRPPARLHPLPRIRGEKHEAVSTPGDLVFHIRAGRPDLCFELATQILTKLAGAVTPVDETQGFRFFDFRDLLGFVDGTENPVGDASVKAALIGAEDPDFAGGSYLVVQKYLHDLDAWNKLPVEAQNKVIGRDKLSNVEMDDAVTPSSAHRILTTIKDDDGNEIKIMRDNMPFGSPAAGEFGTYFIGYAASPTVIEQMLRNMFIGDPAGNYDRILDFSRAVTGNLFFVPSLALLDTLGDD
ncbi:putative iron-dependent peroxidase [Asanoa ferruginea]|uniref:Putative iron-dependent peroxidase n=1 Tax=Asanoa ferruginea TaxID=53367 RepID=A0A3D9ZVL6_9ACTN|nr:Dyp-type peroxidase [Asanoa ferruginea]REG01246.1 putative iron-dependent peroxidase [Asanoa ferruginea]